MNRSAIAALSLLAAVSAAPSAHAEGGWWSGQWYLKVGVAGFRAPKFEGSRNYMFSAIPLVSLGKAGPEARFSSRNDNISFAFVDTGRFRAGAVGKLIFGRDSDDEPETAGLSDVRFGGEAGVFAEVYPTDWLRLRGEVRHGIRSHSGVVADLAADAFVDLTETVRLSAGPRASWGSSDYFDAYYGVTADEAAASGLSAYAPSSGLASVGAGGAVTWQATEKLTASVFGEYSRLMGPAADSSLVRERGSRNQLLIGVSSTYRFDFDL
ncbi:MAG TPA: MipA/OmpV family protein [Rhizobiaceae bacterium]|nr:MipA/OmpV family protein [Rhizobiaceae bacterium]